MKKFLKNMNYICDKCDTIVPQVYFVRHLKKQYCLNCFYPNERDNRTVMVYTSGAMRKLKKTCLSCKNRCIYKHGLCRPCDLRLMTRSSTNEKIRHFARIAKIARKKQNVSYPQ